MSSASSRRKLRSTAGVLLTLLMLAAAVPIGAITRTLVAEAAGPASFFDCTPGAAAPVTCPSTDGLTNTNAAYRGTDDSVNVFVGGNMSVTGAAAEAEGLLVVLGDMSVNKFGGSNRYDVGEAGVGSRITPSPNGDFMLVGGDLTVAAGQLLEAGLIRQGIIRHAGSITGDIVAGGGVVADPNAVASYAGARPVLTALSSCLSSQPATGTITGAPSFITFTGDNTSPTQIFNYDGSVTGAGGVGNGGFQFASIPAGATVIVNMTNSATVDFNTYTGVSGVGLGSGVTREQLLINIPTATTVNLGGQPQFQGSVLVGNPSSVTTKQWAGLDGDR